MAVDYSHLISEIVDLANDNAAVKVIVTGTWFRAVRARQHGMDPNMVRLSTPDGTEVVIHGSQIIAVTVSS